MRKFKEQEHPLNRLRTIVRKQGYFFTNDSDFRDHNGGGIRHDYLNRYSLPRDVTVNRKIHGHAERFRLPDVRLGLFDAYWQLKNDEQMFVTKVENRRFHKLNVPRVDTQAQKRVVNSEIRAIAP